MTRLITSLSLGMLLSALPVTAQEESINWITLPWGSDHATFLARFGPRVVEFEIEQHPYGAKYYTHYKIAVFEFAGVEYELNFREDASHQLTRVDLSWRISEGDRTAQAKVVKRTTAKLNKLFDLPPRTSDKLSTWFAPNNPLLKRGVYEGTGANLHVHEDHKSVSLVFRHTTFYYGGKR